jgi:hypothetical protein
MVSRVLLRKRQLAAILPQQQKVSLGKAGSFGG